MNKRMGQDDFNYVMNEFFGKMFGGNPNAQNLGNGSFIVSEPIRKQSSSLSPSGLTLKQRQLQLDGEEMIEPFLDYPDGSLLPITDENGKQLTKEELIHYYRNVYWTDNEQKNIQRQQKEYESRNGFSNGSCDRNCRGCMHSGMCDEQDAREEEDRNMFGGISGKYGYDRDDDRYGDDNND